MQTNLTGKFNSMISELRRIEESMNKGSTDALLNSVLRNDVLEIEGPPEAMLRIARTALELANCDVYGKTVQYDQYSNLDNCDLAFNLILSAPTNVVPIKP